MQKTETSPHQGDLVKVFVGDSLLKMVLQGDAPKDPNKRIDFFVSPGAKIQDLAGIVEHVKRYYHSINVSHNQLNIMIGLGYNDHGNYGGAIEDLDNFVATTNLRIAFIPPPLPREKKLALTKTEFVMLAKEHRKLVDLMMNINMKNDTKFNCDLFRTSVKPRSKSHFATDNYHFSAKKSSHILDHIRKVFSKNGVFNV